MDSRGQAVAEVLLDRRGYRLVENGTSDRASLAAVIACQRAAGLEPDNVVGPLTWAALTD